MTAIPPPNSCHATLDDLMREPEQAELIDGRIVRIPPHGYRPATVLGEIAFSLWDHVESSGRGHAFTGRIGFAIPKLASGRESFSPDASYYDGPLPADLMHFIPGPPTLAVEVRSLSDYNPAAVTAMADKRADYFEAGTRVVWDVDPIANVIHSYLFDAHEVPVTFRIGDEANAEPAVPGWRVSVDQMFGG